MKKLKKYNEFINENQKWKEILKPKPLDKVLQDLEESGYTPQEKFQFACKNGILSVVKELLKNDRVDPSDKENYSIRWASQDGHHEIVKELLKDERVDPSNYDNESIRLASRYGHIEVVKELLKDNRVDPSDLNNWSLQTSSQYGHLEVVKELLKDDRVDPSDNNNYNIIYASQYGHLEVVKELLKDDRVDPSDGNNDAIYSSSYNGHLEVVKELLKDERVRNSLPKEDLKKYENQIRNLNENQKWKEILKPKPYDRVIQDLEKSNLSPQQKFRFACENGILPLVKELLKDERINPSISDNYIIRMSSGYGHLEVVKELLKDERVDPSTSNNIAIRWASSFGHLEVVKELLKDKRVDPSDRDNDAIRLASRYERLKVVKELLKDKRVRNSLSKEQIKGYENKVKGLNENQKWKEILKPKPYDKVLQDLEKANLSPQEKFQFACENGILFLVKELLKDERVDPSNYYNYSIIYASQYGHLEVVKELLKDERVDPSDGNNNAIMWASQYGHLEVVKELLKDERVRNKLPNHNLEYYENQVKGLNESFIIDGILDKISDFGEKSLTNTEKEILDKYSQGEDIEDLELKIKKSHDDVKGAYDYDPRKDDFFDEIGMDFSGFDDEEIYQGKLNIMWNDLSEEQIDEFFNYFDLNKKDYLNDEGSLPGEIPIGLENRFDFYMKKIF